MTRPPLEWEAKTWGRVMHVFHDTQSAISYLEVEAGTRCSVHHHNSRVNHFVVITGALVVEIWLPNTREAEVHLLRAGETITVTPPLVHRFRVLESGQVIEIYWPHHPLALCSINDIVRRDEGGADSLPELRRLLECQNLL